MTDRYAELAEGVEELPTEEKISELSRLIEIEDDPETQRLLAHNLKYTMRDQSDAAFLTYLEHKRKRTRRKKPYTPEEISLLKTEYTR